MSPRSLDRRRRAQNSLAPDELLTRAETAALLKVSVRTVDRWLADGSLPRVYVGGSVRVQHIDLKTFIFKPKD